MTIHQLIKASLLIAVTFFLSCKENRTKDEAVVLKEKISLTSLFKSNIDIQRFKISVKDSQVIVGKYKTTIELDKGAFNSDSINVELIECFNLADILFNQLVTETVDGKLLCSQGMINVKFKNDLNEEVLPKRGKIKIKLPVKLVDSTKVFIGSKVDGYVKWSTLKNNDVKSEKLKLKGPLAYLPAFIHTSGIGKDFKSDTTYGWIDTSTVRYKYKSVLTSQYAGWINLDYYLQQESKIYLPIANLKPESIGFGIFSSVSTVYAATFLNERKQLAVYDQDSEIIFINEITGDQVEWAIVKYLKGNRESIYPVFRTTSSKILTDVLSEMLESRKTKGFVGDLVP
jgi:hypothetical protein